MQKPWFIHINNILGHPASNRKNAQISCFVCFINNTLIQRATGKKITVTSFYILTACYACWIVMNCMLVPSKFENFASYTN